jgi:hypothetical protein
MLFAARLQAPVPSIAGHARVGAGGADLLVFAALPAVAVLRLLERCDAFRRPARFALALLAFAGGGK